MRLILNLVLMMLLMCGGCTLLTGVEQSLTEMDEAQFTILEKQIYLISNRGFARLFSEKPEVKESIAPLAEAVVPHLDGTDPDTVLFITNLADTILLKIEDPDVKFILELAFLEIQKYGGLRYAEGVHVDIILNMRSVKLVQAILKGLVEALDG